MKNVIKIYLIIFIIGITSCSKDDDPAPDIKTITEPEVVLSSNKAITSFVFLLTNNPIDNNVIGVIDEEAKTITVTMPPSTDITGLLPEIKIQDTATIDFDTAQNFSNPVTYTVTAEDGSKTVYTVTLTKLLTQKGILQTILNANPTNTLGWDLANTATLDLGTLEGVTTDVEGIIIELNLFSKKLIKIPIEIGQLVNLTFLSLHNNELTEIPSEIGELVKLIELALSENKLTELPVEIGKLVKLIELGLSGNEFTELPVEIGNLVNLTTLFLSGNKLTKIPVEIGNLVQLRVLYLYENKLTELPAEIGNLVNLTRFYLNDNPLTELPVEIGNLVNLTTLELIRNKLTELPAEIGKLINLTHLYLNDNKLTNIPVELAFLSRLKVLEIQRNDFSTLAQAVYNLEEFIDEFDIDSEVTIETVSSKDALISIYSANPDNTLDWSVDSFSGVTFDSQQNIIEINVRDKGIEYIQSGVATLETLELLDLRDNPLVTVHSDVCALVGLTVLADAGEGCL